MTEPVDTQVLIVGAGPVGTTLAMDLARLGVQSILIDKRRGVPPNPKCNTTNARSMEFFRRLGCADAVRDAGLPADHNTDIVYMTRLNGIEIVRYERPTTADVRAGTQHGVAANWPTPEPQHFISQLFLEPVIRSHAIEHWGVDLREGFELVEFDHDGELVTATVRDVDTRQSTTIRAQYLVGADGAVSIVRKAIGARLEGIDRLNDMVSTYVRAPEVTDIARDMPGWMLRSAAGRAILVAIDGADGWLFHVSLPDGEDHATWDPRDAMFAAVGQPFEYDVIEQSRWTPRALVADRWRNGNVFLAGDAAHLWVPMGGFGMNAGIADATALSWRLASQLDGWGSEALLDSYEAERSPIGGSIADQAVTWAFAAGIHMAGASEHVELLEGTGDASDAARRELADALESDTLSEFECPGFQLGYFYANSPVIAYDDLTERPQTSVTDYRPTSSPGSRLPHVWLGDGDSIYDHLGSGFTLLRIGPDAPAGAAIVDTARRASVPIDVLDLDAAQVGDVWDDIPLVMVRPDQHVAWRSRSEPDAAEAASIVEMITGRATA